MEGKHASSSCDRREFLRLAGFSTAWLAAGGALTACAGLGGGSAFAPARHVFAMRGDGRVAVIDPDKEAIARMIATGGKGGMLASLTPDGNRLFVANNAPGQRNVTIIDAAGLSVAAQVETGNRPKHPVGSPDGGLVAVNHSALDGGKLRIAFLSAADGKVVKTVELPVSNTGHKGDFSMHGSWSPDGAVYAIGSYADNRIYVIERNGFAVFAIAAQGNPHYFDWRGRQMWATIESDEPKGSGSTGRVQVFDLANPASAKALDAFAFTREASEIANPARIEGHHGVFSNDGSRFIACNRGPGSALEGVTVDIFDAASRKLLAKLDAGAKGVGHAYITPDGRHAVITQYGDTRLPIIDLHSLSIVHTVDAGKGGHLGHAVFSADGRKAFVSNRKADEVLVIDTTNWSIRSRIATGASGQAQGQVVNAFYGVFERVSSPLLA